MSKSCFQWIYMPLLWFHIFCLFSRYTMCKNETSVWLFVLILYVTIFFRIGGNSTSASRYRLPARDNTNSLPFVILLSLFEVSRIISGTTISKVARSPSLNKVSLSPHFYLALFCIPSMVRPFLMCLNIVAACCSMTCWCQCQFKLNSDLKWSQLGIDQTFVHQIGTVSITSCGSCQDLLQTLPRFSPGLFVIISRMIFRWFLKDSAKVVLTCSSGAAEVVFKSSCGAAEVVFWITLQEFKGCSQGRV